MKDTQAEGPGVPELVDRALAGDTGAFSILVRKYQDYAYGVAIGVLADLDLARDVAQESFLCAWRDLPKLKEPARFGGWLGGIARHTAYRALRDLIRVRQLARDLERSGYLDQDEPTGELDEEHERRIRLRRALEGLNAKNREAVALHYVVGMSYREIAEFLGVPEATILGRLQRARETLRKDVETMGDTPEGKRMPQDFSETVRRLLDRAVEKGKLADDAIRGLAALGGDAINPLNEAMEDSRALRQRAAVRALAMIGDPGSVRYILGRMGEGLWGLFETGFLSARPAFRKEVIRFLKTGTRDERYAAIVALAAEREDKEVVDGLLAIFRDRSLDQTIRHAALCHLSEVSLVVFSAVVQEAFADPHLLPNKCAWWEAYAKGVTFPMELARKGFGREAFPHIRWCAVHHVLRHGEEGRNALKEILRSGSPDERATAAIGLATLRDRGALDILMEELADGYQNSRWAKTVTMFVLRNYAPALDSWKQTANPALLNSPRVAWLLERASIETGVLPPDQPPGVQAMALRARAREAGAAIIPELRTRLRDGAPRKVAQEAFWLMHGLKEKAVPVALEMLASEHWTERKAAVSLLRRWNRLSPEQKARASKDPHVAVRHAASARAESLSRPS